MALFSFDTSAFVNPFRRHYPFDVFPTFWRHIEKLIAEGSVVATEVVRDELEQKDDALTAWAKDQVGLFVAVDAQLQLAVTDVVRRFPKRVDPESAKNQGDPFVVALGICRALTVVSDEGNGSEAHPTIPFACKAMKVSHMRVIDFIRYTGLRF
jgi:hypothetical protein